MCNCLIESMIHDFFKGEGKIKSFIHKLQPLTRRPVIEGVIEN